MNSVFEKVPAFKESRLQSLFSDFSGLKDINPEGYEANFSAWQALLLQCLKEHTFESSISLPVGKLSTALSSPQYGQPKSLGEVISTLIKEHVLVPWSIYQAHSPFLDLYLDLISPQKLWLKLVSSFSFKYHVTNDMSHLSHDFYIHYPTLVACSSKINELLKESITRQGSYLARILDFQMFQKFVRKSDSKLSDVDIQAVFVYLSRDRGNIGSQKIPGSNKNHWDFLIKVSDEKAITLEDFEILNLKSNIVKTENRVALLEEAVYQDIPQRLKHLLSIKAPESRLKNVLRKKHQLLQSLDLASSVSNELTLLLNKIDEAQSNSTVYQVLQSAKSALSTLNHKVSVSDMEILTSELEDQVALTNEVSELIGGSSQWNEEDISEEFELLEREYELEKQQQSSKDSKENTSLGKVEEERQQSQKLKKQSSNVEDPDIENILNKNIKNLLLEDQDSKSPEINNQKQTSKPKQSVPMSA